MVRSVVRFLLRFARCNNIEGTLRGAGVMGLSMSMLLLFVNNAHGAARFSPVNRLLGNMFAPALCLVGVLSTMLHAL